MDKKALEPMKKYMGTSTRSMLIAMGCIAALCAVMYFAMDGDAKLGVLIFGAMVFVGILGACVWMQLKLNLLISRFEKAGELEALAEDFNKSVPVARDTIRMGGKYCFGKGSSDAVAYSEITRVVHFCRVTNGAVSERSIRYDTKQKENKFLCGLPKVRGYEQAVAEICAALLEHNPEILIG